MKINKKKFQILFHHYLAAHVPLFEPDMRRFCSVIIARYKLEFGQMNISIDIWLYCVNQSACGGPMEGVNDSKVDDEFLGQY